MIPVILIDASRLRRCSVPLLCILNAIFSELFEFRNFFDFVISWAPHRVGIHHPIVWLSGPEGCRRLTQSTHGVGEDEQHRKHICARNSFLWTWDPAEIAQGAGVIVCKLLQYTWHKQGRRNSLECGQIYRESSYQGQSQSVHQCRKAQGIQHHVMKEAGALEAP